MSKVDAMRALREARMSAAPAVKAAPVTRPSTAPPAKAKKAPVAAPPAPAEGLCGHRSMNGRSCTRDSGHPEKNHRYG
jgi:hypothetical protein